MRLDVTQPQRAPAAWILRFRHRDLHIRAVGEKPLLADAAGGQDPRLTALFGTSGAVLVRTAPSSRRKAAAPDQSCPGKRVRANSIAASTSS
jgi:hypothetical protein